MWSQISNVMINVDTYSKKNVATQLTMWSIALICKVYKRVGKKIN